jgi:hypothetical protein
LEREEERTRRRFCANSACVSICVCHYPTIRIYKCLKKASWRKNGIEKKRDQKNEPDHGVCRRGWMKRQEKEEQDESKNNAIEITTSHSFDSKREEGTKKKTRQRDKGTRHKANKRKPTDERNTSQIKSKRSPKTTNVSLLQHYR